MTTLTLVDPQPMETLPMTGQVFVDYTHHRNNPEFDRREVLGCDASTVRRCMDIERYTFLAWSYTATFKEGV